MKQELIDDIKRTCRVADMMVTQHLCLQRRYVLRSFLFEALIFLSSTLLCIFAFVDDAFLKRYIGQEAKIIIGLFSLGTLFVTYCAEKFDWRVKAAEHSQAAEKFFELKQESKTILKEDDESRATAFIQRYTLIANQQIKICDKDFLAGKQLHLRKVEISKFLDEQPFVFLPFYRIKCFFRDNKSTK